MRELPSIPGRYIEIGEDALVSRKGETAAMKDTVARTGSEDQKPARSFIGCDAHRKYSVFVAMDEQGKTTAPLRVEHQRRELRNFLRHIPAGTAVAVEATGSWYWLVDEIEASGLIPHLAQPFAAKRMTGVGGKKTDSVDARCLATLLGNGTLPETGIPDSANRDLRNLMRTCLSLREYQTALKNRVVAAINAYGLRDPAEDADLFRGKGRVQFIGIQEPVAETYPRGGAPAMGPGGCPRAANRESGAATERRAEAGSRCPTAENVAGRGRRIERHDLFGDRGRDA